MIGRNSINFNNDVDNTKVRILEAQQEQDREAGKSDDERRFAENNKLQTYKSSFQAWKCVSLGCSLLAVVMLASKCYEVSTDLNLLLGIERLLKVSSNGSISAKSSSLTWPPVPIELLLPAANESNLGMETMESNDTMLMSHLQMSLTRELNGDQLLRQEVDAFLVEFKNAKSTLGLSSLLVSVYIISWILMTFAINDTRISNKLMMGLYQLPNDISLRNILLLSVFGAVDIAASTGFILIRVIMYSTKNNSFAIEMLNSVGLKDTPVKLSADQLTAFTALRLIGMRSCSAYVDIYVSVILVFLTVLRLYAVFRALTYYRRLRRLADYYGYKQQTSFEKPQQQQVWSSFGNAGFFQPMISQQSFQPSNQQKQLLQEANRELLNARLSLGYHGSDQVYLTKYQDCSPDSKLNDTQLAEQRRTPLAPSEPPKQLRKAENRTLTRIVTNNEQQQPPVMILPQSAYSTFRGAQVYGARGANNKRQHQSQSDLLLLSDQSARARLVLSEPECESEPVAQPRPRTRRATPIVESAIGREYRLLTGLDGKLLKEEGEVHGNGARRLILASEQPATRTRTTSGQKYRLVAARLKHLPRVLVEPADSGVTPSNGSTNGHLVGDSGNSSSSSSCNPDDSDGSIAAAQLRPKQTTLISTNAGENSSNRLTGLRESEELVTGSLRRHKVYEVLGGASKRPSSLVSKYYYA